MNPLFSPLYKRSGRRKHGTAESAFVFLICQNLILWEMLPEQNTFIDQKRGIRVNQIIYQLYLQPKVTGKVKIGSALLTVNGKIYKSEPFDILVKETSRAETEYLSKDVYLNVEVQDKEVYENQPTVLAVFELIARIMITSES